MREQTNGCKGIAKDGNKGTRKLGNKEIGELKPGNWETWEC